LKGLPDTAGKLLILLALERFDRCSTGGETVTTYLNVTSTPVGLMSISPDHALPSTTVTVEIVGLNTHFASAGANLRVPWAHGPQTNTQISNAETKRLRRRAITTAEDALDAAGVQGSFIGW
jgi:hypothetical protein